MLIGRNVLEERKCSLCHLVKRSVLARFWAKIEIGACLRGRERKKVCPVDHIESNG